MQSGLFHRFGKFSLVLFLLLSVNLGYAKLEVIVKDSPDWGPISKKDVKKLAENIAYHFETHLRPENEIHDAVNVSRTFSGSSFLTHDITDPHVMKCQRLLGPKFRKVKTSFVAKIRQVSNTLTPNAGVCGDTPV